MSKTIFITSCHPLISRNIISTGILDNLLKNNIKIIISHRSGETDDDFIADLAYAYNAFGLKSGAPTKPERLVKYNRLINIIKENE
jgi:enolase